MKLFPRFRSMATAGVALCALMGFASSVQAEGLGLRVGVGDHFQRLELAWDSPSFWSHDFSGGGSGLSLYGELGAAYWHASDHRSPNNIWQFSAIPFLRWTVNDRFFVEAGVGPTVFTRTRFADKNISTAFQFGDHIGAGFYLNRNSQVGLRLSHFSNASIKDPNPGLNVAQLTYTYRY